MLVTVIGLIRFGFSQLFCVMVSVSLEGIEYTRKNRIIISLICECFLFVQLVSWWTLGLDMTSKLYPLIIHLPLIIIFSLVFKCKWHISAISVLIGYLCCQVPRWIGFLAAAAFGSKIADHVFYIAAVFLAYFLLKDMLSGPSGNLWLNPQNPACY